MVVDLNFCLAEQCTCKTAMFNDTTGLYDPITNTGGWGTPNAESSTITSAIITIIPKGYIDPITFTFTIEDNVITQVIREDQFGTPVNVTTLIARYFLSTSLSSIAYCCLTQASIAICLMAHIGLVTLVLMALMCQ